MLRKCFKYAFHGTRAKELLEDARTRLSRLLNCHPEELYFTSGGTEANNWAFKGFAFANAPREIILLSLLSNMIVFCILADGCNSRDSI